MLQIPATLHVCDLINAGVLHEPGGDPLVMSAPKLPPPKTPEKILEELETESEFARLFNMFYHQYALMAQVHLLTANTLREIMMREPSPLPSPPPWIRADIKDKVPSRIRDCLVAGTLTAGRFMYPFPTNS